MVALGDLLLDVVVTPERPLESGTDVPGVISFRRGGSAANAAAAFVRAGGQASLITSLGSDYWAARLAASLRSDGMGLHAVRRAGPSGRLVALVDERGERSFVTERGAADDLRPEDIQAAWIRAADVLHVPAYSLFSDPIADASIRAAELARMSSTLVSSDLSSAGPLLAIGLDAARARMTGLAPDVLFANRPEATAILQQPGRRAWVRLLAQAPLVVVKDGAWGCRVLWRRSDDGGTRQLDVAAKRVRGVDSTGAGDAFAAGFLHWLVRSGGRDAMERDSVLRHAAMAGHRSASVALRRGRPEIQLR